MIQLLVFTFLVLNSSWAYAAISCTDATEFHDSAPAGATSTWSYTVPSGSGLITFIGAIKRHATVTINSATQAGNAMTSARAEEFSDTMGTRFFYIVNPTTGTNNIVVTHSAAPLAAAAVVFTCSGVDTTSPIHDTNSASGLSTTPSVTVATVGSNDVVIDVMGSNVSVADPTVGANQTAFHVGNDGGEVGWGASYQAGSDGGVMSWTSNNQRWSITALSLTPAASAIRAVQPLVFR